MNETKLNLGWVCSKCGASLSPTTISCLYCTNKEGDPIQPSIPGQEDFVYPPNPFPYWQEPHKFTAWNDIRKTYS